MVMVRELVELHPYAEVAVIVTVRVMGSVVLFTYVWVGANPASTTPSPMFHDQLAAPTLLLTKVTMAGEHKAVSIVNAAVIAGYTVTCVVAVSVHPISLLAISTILNVEASLPVVTY